MTSLDVNFVLFIKSISDDYDFTKMAYSILYIMCLPSHGDITETIKLIFSISTVLHNYGTPSSRVTIQKNGPHGENIIDFFLYLLDSYPTNTAAVLDNFIRAVVTNPDETVSENENVHKQNHNLLRLNWGIFD